MNTLICTKIECEEGGKCPECHEGKMLYPRVVNCRCHICPPCSACTDNVLTCGECGYAEVPPINEEKFRHIGSGIMGNYFTRPSIELGDGKRIYDYDYDASSGSTMVYRGKYKGEVTPEDIIKTFGEGTFGHRGPSMHNGNFTYTLITD